MKGFVCINKKSLIYKFGAVLLSALVCASVSVFPTCTTAYAYSSDGQAQIYYKNISDETEAAALNAIASGVKDFDSVIDVSEYQITTDNVGDYMLKTLYLNPECFYLGTSYSYSKTSSGKVVSIKPGYLQTESEAREMKTEFDARIDEILSLVSDDMSDAEKAAVVHDEIILNCAYTVNDGDSIYTSYGALVDGEAVCQGYALSYSYLLSLLGIETEIISSESMDHAWIKAKIDGNWYNIDITWDDPSSDNPGHAEHTYFLLSDDKICEKDERYDCSAVFEASNTRYDLSPMHDINSKLCKVSGAYYGVYTGSDYDFGDSIVRLDTDFESASLVKELSYRWSAGDGYYWSKNYTSLETKNGLLYFNSDEDIYTYDVSSSTESLAYENVLGDNTAQLESCYGIVFKGNKLYAAVSENPNTAFSLNLVAIVNPNIDVGESAVMTLEDGTDTKVLKGDVNGDGLISIIDSTYAKKHVVGIVTLDESSFLAADSDSNGIISIIDCTAIQKYLVTL